MDSSVRGVVYVADDPSACTSTSSSAALGGVRRYVHMQAGRRTCEASSCRISL
jgi:hypothetical protein